MVLAAGLRGVRRVRLVVFKHCDLRAAGRRRRAYQPAELLLYYAHLVWPERAGLPWRFVGAVQPAERAVPALLVAAGARPDELVPGGSGRLPALHSGVDLRGHCADGVARRQGVPQQKAGHCLPLPAADDVQRMAGLHGQQPLFLRRTGAKHAAARARRRAGRAALAGHRPQAVGRAGGLLYVPVLRHV